MTAHEWAAFAAELGHAFRGGFGPTGPDDTNGAAQEATYAHHLAGLDYDVAAAAVALLVEDGQVFLPTPGELREAVRRVTHASSAPFAEAWRLIGRELRRHYVHPDTSTPEQLGEADRAFVAAVAEHVGEGAARWAQARGRLGLGMEAVDGEHAGAVRHRLEGEYSTFVAQAEEDRRVGLAIARAERAALTTGRPSGPRRLDPAEALALEAPK